MKGRPVPALALFVLSPLIAEYLLGSLSLAQLNALPVMCLLYGGGAVLIRELARATGKGWKAIALLGGAYALVEEGLVTQSLFNPNYLGLRLLDYGYLPAAGIGLPWTLYVLGLHVVWSVCVPIALVEALFPGRATTTWLPVAGRVTFGILYLAGAAVVFAFSFHGGHFLASPWQLAVVAAATVALIVTALRSRSFTTARASSAAAPRPVWVMMTTFVLGSLWSLAQGFRQSGVAWPWAVLVMLSLELAAIAAIGMWSRRAGWSALHTGCAGLGGLAVYCWFGYTVERSLHGDAALTFHSVLVVGALLLGGLAILRVRSARAAIDRPRAQAPILREN